MKIEQLEAIVELLKEAGQEGAKAYYEDEQGNQVPVVATIKQNGVV